MVILLLHECWSDEKETNPEPVSLVELCDYLCCLIDTLFVLKTGHVHFPSKDEEEVLWHLSLPDHSPPSRASTPNPIIHTSIASTTSCSLSPLRSYKT